MDAELIKILNDFHHELDTVGVDLPDSIRKLFNDVGAILNEFDPIPEE